MNIGTFIRIVELEPGDPIAELIDLESNQFSLPVSELLPRKDPEAAISL